MHRKRKKASKATLASLPTAPRGETNRRSWSWQTSLAAALIAAATLAVYANGLQGPFVLDDLKSIPANESIREFWSLGKVLSPPCYGETVSGRPVLNLSLR